MCKWVFLLPGGGGEDWSFPTPFISISMQKLAQWGKGPLEIRPSSPYLRAWTSNMQTNNKAVSNNLKIMLRTVQWVNKFYNETGNSPRDTDFNPPCKRFITELSLVIFLFRKEDNVYHEVLLIKRFFLRLSTLPILEQVYWAPRKEPFGRCWQGDAVS